MTTTTERSSITSQPVPPAPLSLTWLPLKIFLKQYFRYWRKGEHDEKGYFAMRQLHYLTLGRLSRCFCRLRRFWGGASTEVVPPSDFFPPQKFSIAGILQTIDDRGYDIIEPKLPAPLVVSLREWALRTPSQPQAIGGRSFLPQPFDPESVQSVRYDFDMKDLLANKDVQKLATDPALLALAESYLGKNPKLDLVSMWWTAPFGSDANNGAAQLYHADIDRVRFLKFFFFLTDVTAETGPHAYVKGSHKDVRLLDYEDRRYTDQEIRELYGREREAYIMGEAGTIFVADTLGFHKGCVLQRGHRLVFQIQFSNSYFGAVHPPRLAVRDAAPEVLAALSRRPEVYEAVLGRG